MRLETVIGRFKANYERAVKMGHVVKPMSYALYHTWQWANEYEKPREPKADKGDEQ